MSISRRACGNRKVVLCQPDDIDGSDSAIDWTKSDVQAYWDSLFDIQYLAFKPSESPTFFSIHPPSPNQKDHCTEVSLRKVVEWFICCCLIDHENYDIINDDGEVRIPDQPDNLPKGKLGRVSSEKWYKQMDFCREHKQILFAMIEKIGEASGPLYKHSSQPSGDAG